jgi:acetyl/propionyl-CoA carboxylase alpha subunit
MLKVKVNGKQEFQVNPESSGALKGDIDGAPYELDLVRIKEGSFHVMRNGKSFRVEVLKHDALTKTLTMLVNGNRYTLELRDKYDELLSSLGMNVGARVVKEMKAPMPGMVLDVLVKAGESITKDQALIVLEAMKMENVLKAPADAVIKSVNISKGNAVEKNQVLISFE